VKTIGSLFTLAGETLSAIGRMIERPGFNDEAAEAYLSESAVINKATADTLRASMGRMESDGPDAADVLADLEERTEVHEPGCSRGAFRSGGQTYETPGRSTKIADLDAIECDCGTCRAIRASKTSAATPDSAAEGPNPGNPPTGLGHLTSECPGCYDFACPGPHPTSPGASPVSQPAAAAVPGEAVGAVESSSGDGADWPLGELLKESGRLLWAYGIGEASEYTMHLAMQLRTAALRISDTE